MTQYFAYNKTILGASSTVNGSTHSYNYAPAAGSIWSYTGSTFTHVVKENDGAVNYNGDPSNEQVSPSERVGGSFPQVTEIGGVDRVVIYDFSFTVTDGTNTYTIAVIDADLNNDNDLQDASEDGYYLIFEGDVPPPGVPLTVQNGISNPTSRTHVSLGAQVVCFTPGTGIATPQGNRAVEDLAVGDLVITADNGLQAIRWIGKKYISGARLYSDPKIAPVKICAHSFGEGKPSADIWVSPQHRMLQRDWRSDLYLGSQEMLVSAQNLINGTSIYVDYSIKRTYYIHILFDTHQLVFANSMPTESFFPGHYGLHAIEKEQLDELFCIFPELRHSSKMYGQPARPLVKKHELSLFQNMH